MLSVELESMRGEREFISELAAALSNNVKRENLVSLCGCCVDGATRFLVEQDRSRFGWTQRRDISLGDLLISLNKSIHILYIAMSRPGIYYLIKILFLKLQILVWRGYLEMTFLTFVLMLQGLWDTFLQNMPLVDI